ncbi:hypothetical protein ACFUYF_02375, partial [Streptomyces sp. NPDC057381]
TTEDELVQPGDKVRQAMKTAPTRPHPSAPGTPPPERPSLLGPRALPPGADGVVAAAPAALAAGRRSARNC